jgi:hypothetical protein
MGNRFVFECSDDSIEKRLSERVENCIPFHFRNEVIASSILDMMLEKTNMYGGGKCASDYVEQATKSYYEGIGRKTDRVFGILKRLPDESAKIELIDTLVDIAGYAIMAINSLEKLDDKV